MGRTGKIARLPFATRTELNRRIEDGEPARALLEWLNACPAVQETLVDHFDGRPITEQNLSEWRQRGFVEWQRNQETRELAREFLHEAEEVEDEVGETSLTNRLTETVALSLARLLREVVNDGEKGSERQAAVVAIAREFSRLRRGDHAMQRLSMEQEDRDEAEREDELQEFVEKAQKIEAMEARIWADHVVSRQDFDAARKEGRLSPEEEKKWLAGLAKTAEFLAGVRKRGPLPTRWELRRQLSGTHIESRMRSKQRGANPTKSD